MKKYDYDIVSYEKKGYDFSFMHESVYGTFNAYLCYRENLGYPIKVFDSIYQTFSRLKEYSPDQQVEILNNCIESGFATIRYPKIYNNGTKQQTSKTGRIDTTDLERYINGKT